MGGRNGIPHDVVMSFWSRSPTLLTTGSLYHVSQVAFLGGDVYLVPDSWLSFSTKRVPALRSFYFPQIRYRTESVHVVFYGTVWKAFHVNVNKSGTLVLDSLSCTGTVWICLACLIVVFVLF
jgi:hypothetical protein